MHQRILLRWWNYNTSITMKFTTKWIELQMGIAVNCTLSPVVCTGSTDNSHSHKSHKQSSLGRCILGWHDMTLRANELKAWEKLGRLNKLVIWCHMSFKWKKSQSLSQRKRRVARVRYTVAGSQLPTVEVKCLGRRYVSVKKSVLIKQICEIQFIAESTVVYELSSSTT